MNLLLSMLFGYLLGSLSPSYLISKIKHADLRQQGTGNLGATNTMLVLGKCYGVLVMLFDISKSVLALKLAAHFVSPIAGTVAGAMAVVGHIFPFYLRFKGGKGLAAFGGFVLASDPLVFVILLFVAVVLMLIFNYGVAMPITGTVLFPIIMAVKSHSPTQVAVVVGVSLLVAIKHAGNLDRAVRGEDIKVREYIKNNLLKKKP